MLKHHKSNDWINRTAIRTPPTTQAAAIRASTTAMSFFTRTVIGLAIAAGIVHVFKKDLRKLAQVLQKPTETFVKDVRKGLDATKPTSDKAASLEDAVTPSVHTPLRSAESIAAASTPPTAPLAPPPGTSAESSKRQEELK